MKNWKQSNRTEVDGSIRLTALALLLLGAAQFVNCQPGDLFGASPTQLHAPLDLPLHVTGDFGEFRWSQFHLGVDLSTDRQIGRPVYAADDGYVFRLMYGRYDIGYGLWINHPGERQTLYGHLSRFAPALLERLPELAEKIKLREEFNVFPAVDAIPVRRGDLIAYSGDSGIGIAHLHFEYSERGISINPLAGLLPWQDTTPPTMESVRFAPVLPRGRVNGGIVPVEILLRRAPGPSANGPINGQDSDTAEFEYRADQATELELSGPVRVLVSAYDQSGNSRLGLYSARLFLNEEMRFSFQIERMRRLPADASRLLYQGDTQLAGPLRFVYRLYEPRRDGLPFVESEEAGEIELARGAGARVRVQVTDASGNRSWTSIAVKGGEEGESLPETPNVRAGEENLLRSTDEKMEVRVGSAALFEDRRMEITIQAISLPAHLPALSSAYAIGPEYRDFLAPIEVSIRANASPKAALYVLDRAGLRLVGTNYAAGAYRALVRSTGTYVVLEDHRAPVFRGLPNAPYRGDFRLLLRPIDYESGIDPSSVVVEVDGISCRVDHDPDYGTYEVFYPEQVHAPGRHQLTARAKDRARNEAPEFHYAYTVLP